MAFHCAYAGKRSAACAAGIEISAFKTDALQRKIVAPGFVRDAEILAGLAPLDPMGCDLTAAGAMLRKKVGELMAQGALNLRARNFDEFRVERDRLGPPASETRSRSESRIPFDGHLEPRTSRRTQELATEPFQENVALGLTRYGWLRAGICDRGKKAQMTKNRFSEVERDEGLFHQAAMG
jgi:hypothetical protein